MSYLVMTDNSVSHTYGPTGGAGGVKPSAIKPVVTSQLQTRISSPNVLLSAAGSVGQEHAHSLRPKTFTAKINSQKQSAGTLESPVHVKEEAQCT